MTKWNEDQEKIIAQFESKLPFTDRESYLAWRAEWRKEYAALSADIRRLRREIAANGSNVSWKIWSERNYKSSNAYDQMLIRAASKRKAGKQRAAELAEKAAA